MDGLSVAASVIAVIQITGSCLKLIKKWLGRSEFSASELSGLSAALYEFNGTMKTFQTHLEVYEDNNARLKSLECLTPVLENCGKALGAIEGCLKRSSFLGSLRNMGVGKFDGRLKDSLKALDRAKELFMMAVHADQQ